MSTSRLVVAIFGLAAVTLAAGCPNTPPVSPPATDDTPPTLTWRVLNRDTNQTTVYPATAEVPALPGERFTFTMVVDDPQGVKLVTIGSSTSWSCEGRGVGSQSGPSLGSTENSPSTPDANGRVPTQRILARMVDFGPFNCSSGMTLSTAAVEYSGRGENYGGGTVRGKLTFVSR